MPSQDNIRAFKANDLKMARFLIGTSSMAPLAVANSSACTHPFTIALWLGLASVMIQLLDWWPTTSGPSGKLGLLTPFPALAAVAVPLMFLFDWLHRPIFEEELQKALSAPDMKEPQTHYSKSPASGFYILEHNGQPIGLIALDASVSSNRPPADTPSSKTKKELSAEAAVIQHFHVEEVYRTSGVQSDLLEHAITRAFAPTSPLGPRKVLAMASTLDAYKIAALQKAGFRPTSDFDALNPQERKVGVFGWKHQCFEITREEWKEKGQ